MFLLIKFGVRQISGSESNAKPAASMVTRCGTTSNTSELQVVRQFVSLCDGLDLMVSYFEVEIGQFTKDEVKVKWAERKAECETPEDLHEVEEFYRNYLISSKREKAGIKVDKGDRAKLMKEERGTFAGRVSIQRCF